MILLRPIGVSSSDLINVLQPVQGQSPSTEADFDAMCMTLRRMGHIRENAPCNLAHAQRSSDRGNAMFVEPDGMAFPSTQTGHDPWTTADPWGGSSATYPHTSSTPATAIGHAGGFMGQLSSTTAGSTTTTVLANTIGLDSANSTRGSGSLRSRHRLQHRIVVWRRY